MHTVDAASGSVSFSQATTYVRARISYVEGGKVFYAWTQPVFVP